MLLGPGGRFCPIEIGLRTLESLEARREPGAFRVVKNNYSFDCQVDGLRDAFLERMYMQHDLSAKTRRKVHKVRVEWIRLRCRRLKLNRVRRMLPRLNGYDVCVTDRVLMRKRRMDKQNPEQSWSWKRSGSMQHYYWYC